MAAVTDRQKQRHKRTLADKRKTVRKRERRKERKKERSSKEGRIHTQIIERELTRRRQKV